MFSTLYCRSNKLTRTCILPVANHTSFFQKPGKHVHSQYCHGTVITFLAKVGYVFGSIVCLSVRLFVDNVTPKVINGLG